MPAIDAYEKELIMLSLHAEDYEHLQAEFEGNDYILRDCLRSLIKKKLMFALVKGVNGEWNRSLLFDTDKLQFYRFQASAKGMEMLSQKHG